MRKKLITAVSVAVVASGLALAGSSANAASCAGVTNPNTACTVALSAVVGTGGLTGVRTLTAVTPVTLAGTGSLTGALAAEVIETAATGAPWSVSAVSTNANLTDSNSDTISASHLTLTDTGLPVNVGCLSTLLPVGQQCTVTGGAANRALDTTKTLFSVANESTSASYTGTYDYTGLLTLAVPNGTPAGTYNDTLTLTLLQ